MNLRVGSLLKIGEITGKVIGLIEYANPNDNNKRWTDYRLKTNMGERWLSIDNEYKEYSLSWADNSIRGNIGPEWHKVDQGRQIVKRAEGDVDVDYGEAADFLEFEDETDDSAADEVEYVDLSALVGKTNAL